MMADEFKVLVLEDSPNDYELLLREFKRAGLQVSSQRVWSADAFRQALAGPEWDIVISDYSMPGFTALDALDILNEHTLDIPLIVVSGQIGEDIAVGAMRAGASDYVIKGRLARLVPAIQRELREAQVRHEHRQDRAEKHRLAEQFLQAQKMEAVGQLAAGIAHDFNNQLTIIRGYGELLRERLGDDEKGSDWLQEVLRASQRARQLTDQLTSFGRKKKLHPEIFSLSETVANLQGPLGRMVGEQSGLTIEAGMDMCNVFVDRSQIEQAIVNLVINARDALKDGDGHIAVRVYSRDIQDPAGEGMEEIDPGQFAVLEVADTGCGMDAETMNRVFEPFFTTKEVGRGTGRGLAMVYGFVRQSSGHITVHSTPGEGTIFRIYLPELDQAAAAVGDETEDFDDAGTEHIFVVEDDQAVRSLMVDALDRWGYQTTVCSSPDEALKKIEDQAPQFDLLLTDVVMPGMNGLEMARRIHAQYKLQRVLYVSGYAEGQLDASQLKSPPGEVLPKPFTPRELARAVRRALDELHPSDGSPDVGEYTNDQTETPATGRQ